MKYFFHPHAELELNDGIQYYEEHQKGLGQDFAIEVNLTIERILLYPDAWPEVDKGIEEVYYKGSHSVCYTLKKIIQ